MKRDWLKTATWLAWLALPTTALNYWRAWDRLPMRIAVHFNANGQPNGFASREESLQFALGLITVMLIVCTIASYAMRAFKLQSTVPAMIVLFALYVALAFCWYGSNAIVEHSLDAQPHSRLVHTNFPQG